MMRSVPFILLLLALPGVTAQGAAPGPPPPELLGDFRDDYGNSFRITESLFVQLPRLRYHVVEWNVAERYLVARNDSANPSDQGLWTRIDWMPFTGMAPYGWGFCLTAYRAPSEAAARSTAPPDRANPRTGCNGFPFSRMRRPDVPPSPLQSIPLPPTLERVLRDYERAWRAGDVAALVALFTEDGFVLQPGRPPARGRAALAEVYRGQGGGPLRLRALAYGSSDSVAYIIGAYGYSATGSEVSDEGKFTLTLRRGADGRWLIASDMDNGDRPAGRP